MISSILTDEAITAEEWDVLRGHLAFLASTTFDRLSRTGVHLLEQHAHSPGWPMQRLALRSLQHTLSQLGPRHVQLAPTPRH
eukprot:4691134-Amphidinium_carterae.1